MYTFVVYLVSGGHFGVYANEYKVEYSLNFGGDMIRFYDYQKKLVVDISKNLVARIDG